MASGPSTSGKGIRRRSAFIPAQQTGTLPVNPGSGPNGNIAGGLLGYDPYARYLEGTQPGGVYAVEQTQAMPTDESLLPPVDDGSGSGGGAPAPAQTSLYDSPEWLAYLSALGLEEQQVRSDVDRSRAFAQSDARSKLDALPGIYGLQRRGITGSLEGRGMARSGELLRKLAENRGQQGRAQSNIESGLANSIGSLESQLAAKIAGLQTQRADRELQLRSSGQYY